MNSFLAVVIAVTSIWLSASMAMGQGAKRLAAIGQLLNQGKSSEALVEGRKYLEELRGTMPEPDHPAIGFAAVVTGKAASRTGAHEEAVPLLYEGLPILAKMRKGHLYADEFNVSEPLVTSLQELGRSEDAIVVLRTLVDRARKAVETRGSVPGKLWNNEAGANLGELLINEDGLVALLERVGTLQLEREQWEEAEDALKEAEEILKRIHPEQQAQVAKLREGWEQAARAQGKAIRPQLVGRFGNLRTIRIEGEKQIPKVEIYSALTRSSTYVLASHPSAEFEDFLVKLQRCLELGYRTAGFPDTTVDVAWDEGEDAVVARIVEGPRFKKGEIRISGAVELREKELLDRLEDTELKPLSRAESVYQALAAQKRMPSARVMEEARKVFPGILLEERKEEEHKPLFPGLVATTDTTASGVWKKGKWIDYNPSFLKSVAGVLHAAYAEEGRFFAKFEIKVVPGREPGMADLEVEVIEEGPPARLRHLHVAGNRINTREELLQFVGLDEGMDLKGDFMDRVKRRLYESGRFLGWEVLSQRATPKSSEIDLLVLVAEEWEAPPLSEPLTREQEASLRFARWINTQATGDSDLVVSRSEETEHGPLTLEFAVGREAVALSADGLGHYVRAVAEWDGQAELVIGADRRAPFYAAVPMKETSLKVFAHIIATVPSDPYGNTGTFNFGAAFSTSGTSEKLVLAMDPAAALSMCGSKQGWRPRIEQGELVLESEEMMLRFYEQSGRLISLRMVSQGAIIIGKAEVGAVARIKKEVRERSQGIDNWLERKNPFSIFFQAMGFGAELVQDDDSEEETDSPADLLTRAASRSKRWEPLSVILGDVIGSIGDVFGIGKKEESPTEVPFMIPLDSEEMDGRLQAGGNLYLALNLGIYDLLAQYLEPGSWPDMVSREILFYLDGKPFYLNQTVETLLEDGSMGPFGCLLCSRLLQQVGHPAAARFAQKASDELNSDGFAKDWTLALRGTASEDGFGWKILNALRRLTNDEIDGFLPADPPEVRGTFKELVATSKNLEPESNAEALAPAMDSLWENVLDTLVEGLVDDTVEGLTPKVDPKLVAATVNGLPVLRGVVRLVERADEQNPNALGQSSFEGCVTMLLMAQEMWTTGRAPEPAIVENQMNQIVQALGADGWEQIAKMGLTKEQLQWWVGVKIAGLAQMGELVNKGQIEEKEVRDFYERHKAFFGAGGEERQIYSIRLDPTVSGSHRKLA